jgi:hypothetical protein
VVAILSASVLASSCAVRQAPASQKAPADRRTQSNSLPAVHELGDGWNQLRPGGETICAKATPYHFYARRGSPEKLLVYFEGGGACWTGEDCERGRPNYHPDLVSPGPAVNPGLRGILDLANSENPFADRSAVLVQYCTGDVHLGDRATPYTVASGSGEARSFTIHHRGQVNAMAVLRWVYENFAAPREIFVSGSSAGGVATPYYATVLAQHYPNARVVALSDASGMLHGAAIAGADFGRWGHPDVMRRQPGWEKLPEDWGTPDLFVMAARSAPNLKLFQIDHAYDQPQYSFVVLSAANDMAAAIRRLQAGVQGSELVGLLRANRKEIGAQIDTFRSFTVGGRVHDIVPTDRFYAYETAGTRVRDWVASIASGQSVASVDCTDCWRPQFRFVNQDLRIIERTLELLSPAGVWDPQDRAGAPCPASANRYTLKCALRKAAGDVTGVTPNNEDEDPAGVSEVAYSIIDRMGIRERLFGGPPLVVYNNRLGTTVADVIALLEQVRDRIRVDLRARSRQ